MYLIDEMCFPNEEKYLKQNPSEMEFVEPEAPLGFVTKELPGSSPSVPPQAPPSKPQTDHSERLLAEDVFVCNVFKYKPNTNAFGISEESRKLLKGGNAHEMFKRTDFGAANIC